jgi:predicted flavoprotein YhiN
VSREVVVVGAGAAGLTAALRAAEAGARVTLLNAHPRIGLKILMSGGTRCNVTHEQVNERDFNGGSRPFVARILRAFPAGKTREWFESLGVELKLEPTGKLFPATDDAHTVLDALLGAVGRAGVTVESGARVVRIEKTERFRLAIQQVAGSAEFGPGEVASLHAAQWPLPAVIPARWIAADAVVLATGGLSFPRTGSDGTPSCRPCPH